MTPGTRVLQPSHVIPVTPRPEPEGSFPCTLEMRLGGFDALSLSRPTALSTGIIFLYPDSFVAALLL